MKLFFHGHAPGKNTVTRRFFRRKTAKPARRPEPNLSKNPTKWIFDSLKAPVGAFSFAKNPGFFLDIRRKII